MSAGIPANTYWAVPQRVLAGPHPGLVDASPRGLRGGLERLLDVGMRRFVDLTAYEQRGEWRILREGALSLARLREALA